MPLNIWEESSLAGAIEDEAVRKTLRLFLEGGFGAVDNDVMEAINRADETLLEELARHAATDTKEQFRARLGLS